MASILVLCCVIWTLSLTADAGLGLLGGSPDSDTPASSNIADRASASDSFTCPGVGTYAVKKPKRNSCTLFYECTQANVKARNLRQCFPGKQFHRLSRTCVDEKLVKCKWCTKEGRHADITSKSHFIECVPGSIAIRYRCRDGKYNVEKRECDGKEWTIFDITIDAEVDQPVDIAHFQERWNDRKQANPGTDSIEDHGGSSTKSKKEEGGSSTKSKKEEEEEEEETEKNGKKVRKDENGENGARKDKEEKKGLLGIVNV